MPEEKYNAMQDFQKRGIEYLFKQPPAAVLAIVFLGIVIAFSTIMWKKIDRTEENCDVRIREVNRDWADALNKNNISLNQCMAQKDTLFKMYAVLNARVSIFEQQRRVDRKQKMN